MRQNIDVEDDKCCNTCIIGHPVFDHDLGDCIICRLDDTTKNLTDICEKFGGDRFN